MPFQWLSKLGLNFENYSQGLFRQISGPQCQSCRFREHWEETQALCFSPAPHPLRLVLLSGNPTLRITALIPGINKEAQVQRDGTICWGHKMDNPNLCWSWACGESMLEHMCIAGYGVRGGGATQALQSYIQTRNETW